MKKQIKNLFLSIFVIMLVLVGNSYFVFAQVDTKTTASQADIRTTSPQADIRTTSTQADIRTTAPSNIFTLQNPLKVDSIGGLVQAFLEIITYVVIIFAVLMFIWIGFKYVMSAASGNAAEIKKLHLQLMWLVIGVAIIIAARVIVQVVINTISATGTVSPNVIQSANNALNGK